MFIRKAAAVGDTPEHFARNYRANQAIVCDGVAVAENAIPLHQALLTQRQRAVVFALGTE